MKRAFHYLYQKVEIFLKYSLLLFRYEIFVYSLPFVQSCSRRQPEINQIGHLGGPKFTRIGRLGAFKLNKNDSLGALEVTKIVRLN